MNSMNNPNNRIWSTRGTAVGTLLMFGRVGSVVGANVAGVSLAVACSATFYGFSALLFREFIVL